MNVTLLELTQNYFLGSTVRQVSAAFGESEDRVSAALRRVGPLVLGGLLARAQVPGGAAELTAWAQRVHKRGLLSDLSGLLGGLSVTPAAATSPAGSLPNRGAEMMHSLLGAEYLPAIAGVSQQTGLQPTTVSNLGSVTVAAVLGLLGRHLTQHNLDADGLSSYLGSQRGYILDALAALPDGLGRGIADLVTGGPATKVEPITPIPSPNLVATRAAEVATLRTLPVAPIATTATIAQPVVPAEPPQLPVRPVAYPAAPAPAVSRRWPWLLLLALGLAALGYVLLSRRPQLTAGEPGTTPPAATTRLATPATRVAAPTGHYEAATDTYRYDAGTSTTLSLPAGTTLRVGHHSAEAQLWQLLTDSTQVLSNDKTLSGILLDQVYFDAGRATLTAASQAQLANLATLLAAFPRATLKFGGFTDDQGPAEANLLLSADRANAVRNTLLAKGISPARVAAQGYGQTHPVASNASPAGRAQNRRVAVLLTSK